MIQLSNYTVSVADKQVVNNISLTLESGSLHVLMGPNGSGKSSLALSLMGHKAYAVTGSAIINGHDLLSLSVDKRAQLGLFLSFQQPYEIPGVPLSSFFKVIYEAKYGPIEPKKLQEKLFVYFDLLEIDHAFYYRNLHEGFSGGQKKKLEMLQLLLLKPRVALLDEIDSGLDVDALRVVAHALTIAREENPEMTIMVITHYQRLLQYLQIDHLHILVDGSLVKSGDSRLAQVIEQQGYDTVVL
jgi:Fe-S cluster assembly ATP-binding protein